MTISLGMNVSVCSWIDVTAWKIETSRPTVSPATRNGIETLRATVMRLDGETDDGVWVMGSSRSSGVE